MAANPESDFTYDLGNDGLIILSYEGKSTVVDIPETIEGEKVVEVRFIQPKGSPESKIKEITIPKTVRRCTLLAKNIAGNFFGAYRVEKLIIKSTLLQYHPVPESVTTAGAYHWGFERSLYLKEVQLPEGMRVAPAFEYAPSLEVINFPSSLEVIPANFIINSKLKCVDLSNTKVCAIGRYAFAHNFEMEKVIFPAKKVKANGGFNIDHELLREVDASEKSMFAEYSIEGAMQVNDKYTVGAGNLNICEGAFSNGLEVYEENLYKILTKTQDKPLPTKRVLLLKVPDWSIIGPVVENYFMEHPCEFVFSDAYNYTFGCQVFSYKKIAETTNFSKLKASWEQNGIDVNSCNQFEKANSLKMSLKLKKQIKEAGYTGSFE